MEHQEIKISRKFTKEERDNYIICFGNKWVKYENIRNAILIYKDDENVTLVTSERDSWSTNKFIYINDLYQLLIDLLCDEETLLDSFATVCGTRKIILSPTFRKQGVLLQFNPVQKSVYFIFNATVNEKSKNGANQIAVSSYCIVNGMDHFIWRLACDISCLNHATCLHQVVPQTPQAQDIPDVPKVSEEDKKFEDFLKKTIDKVYANVEKQNEGWVDVDMEAMKRSMTLEDRRVVKKMKMVLKKAREAEEKEEESDENLGDDSDEE